MSKNPNEIFNLLESWGLSDLKSKFKANYIVLQALEYLTEADIIELIPKIGQRAIFRGKLNQWRQQNSTANINVPVPKKIKLEAGIENDMKSPPQVPVENQNQIITQQPVQNCQNVIERILKPGPKPRSKRANKKANDSNSTPNMQSKVQQFIIGSPPTTKTTTNGVCQPPNPPPINPPKNSLPSLPSPPFFNHPQLQPYRLPAANIIRHPISTYIHAPVSSTPARVNKSDKFCYANSIVRLPSSEHGTSPSLSTDLTPFATSIIRVKTNTEEKSPGNGTLKPHNALAKCNRTTIIQKLKLNDVSPPHTNLMKPSLALKPIEQLRLPAIAKSPPVPKPKLIIVPKEEPIEIEDDDLLESTNWNDFYEERKNPTPMAEPKPNPISQLETLPPFSPETLPALSPAPELGAETDLEPEQNPEVEEFTLSDNVTDIPELIKDELMDSDSRSDQECEKATRQHDDYPRSEVRPKETNRLDIRKILTNSKNGRTVLRRYVAEEMLDEQTRRLLIDVIAQHCFDNKIHITPTYCKDLAEEIIEIFPNERREDYYSGRIKKTRPLIYTKFYSIRREATRRRSNPLPIGSNNQGNKSLQENDDDDDLIIS